MSSISASRDGAGSVTPRVYAVVFAGGTGERMNTQSTPKQFLQIHGQTILDHTLRHFLTHRAVSAVVVVCLESWLHVARAALDPHISAGRVILVPGGDTTQASVRAGLVVLSEIANSRDVVLVHDAVRPLISAELIETVIGSVTRHGNGITVSPQNETVVTVDEEGLIKQVLERAATRVAKAPQGFRYGDLMEGHEWALSQGRVDFIDSASLMQAHGHQLHPVEGPPENIKVTTPTDFYIVRAVLDAHEAQQVFGLHMAPSQDAHNL